MKKFLACVMEGQAKTKVDYETENNRKARGDDKKSSQLECREEQHP